MKLQKWLKRTSTKPKTLAAKMDVDQSTIYRYLQGVVVPPVARMDLISRITKGDVTRMDW